MRARALLGGLGLALTVMGSFGCRPKEKSSAPAPAPKAPLAPWSWHAFGGILVVEGEVDAPTELVLKGRTLHERRFVEFGPVRWEMYRPPKGEIAELRTGTGELLATWDFDRPLPPGPKPGPPKPVPPAARPEPARPEPKPKPTPPAPKPEPPAKPAPAPSPVKPVPALPKPEPKKPVPAQPVQKPTPRPAPKPPQPVKPTPPPPAPQPARPTPPKPEPKKPEPKQATPAPTPKPPPSQPPAPMPAPTIPTPASPWPGEGEGFNLLRGPRTGRMVCLTFDGGSNAEVATDVLGILKARSIRTTFFLTGAFIRKFPDLVMRIARDGHEIGNHTKNHPHFAPGGRRDPAWTREGVQAELREADRIFLELMGRPMDPLWRAPYGEHTLEIRKWAEELGYRHVGWSEGADTLDWATKKERALYRTGHAILDRLRARMERQDGEGLIVLMHLGSERPVEDRPARVLGPFIDRALQEGWRFVSVGDYLRAAGKPAWDRDRRLPQLR